MLQERDDRLVVIIEFEGELTADRSGIEGIDPVGTNERITVVAHTPSGAESRISGTTPKVIENRTKTSAYKL